MLAWLDAVPRGPLALLALLLAIAPWPLAPEPHLVEKLRMLAAGTLRHPVDIFDLIMHGLPLVLVGIQNGRALRRRFRR